MQYTYDYEYTIDQKFEIANNNTTIYMCPVSYNNKFNSSGVM